MADVSLGLQLNANAFVGDATGIVDGSDVAATVGRVEERMYWEFADGSDEVAIVLAAPVRMPTQYDGTSSIAFDIGWFSGAAGAGDQVHLEVAVEALTESDAHDLSAGGDFFAAAVGVSDTVDVAQGEPATCRVTLTNAQADAVAVGDWVRIVVRRNTQHADDDHATQINITSVEILQV